MQLRIKAQPRSQTRSESTCPFRERPASPSGGSAREMLTLLILRGSEKSVLANLDLLQERSLLGTRKSPNKIHRINRIKEQRPILTSDEKWERR